MFRKLFHGAVAAGIFALAPLATAKAATCTTGSLVFCFDFTFTNTSFSLTFNPTASGFNSTGVLTEVGITGYTGITGVTTSNAAFTGSVSTNGNCAGLGSGTDVGLSNFVACAGTTGINGGLTNGGSLTLSFTGTPVEGSAPGADVHLQAVNGTDCSLHINVVTDVVGGNTGNCGGGTTTTPEPASIVLVGTGLAGLGGLVRRRRRNA